MLPSRNSIARYWADWNPDDVPSAGRNVSYSDGVSVSEHRPLLEELLLDELHAREDLEAGVETIVADERDRRLAARGSSSFIQSSEVWCWMMNSISSWRAGAPPDPDRRLLRGEQLVEAQVAGVGQAVGEVGDDARFEIARGHGVRLS